jgi:hypothetical protein
MYISTTLLGNGSVETLLLQQIHTQKRRIVERVVSYAVRVVSKKVSDYFDIMRESNPRPSEPCK